MIYEYPSNLSRMCAIVISHNYHHQKSKCQSAPTACEKLSVKYSLHYYNTKDYRTKIKIIDNYNRSSTRLRDKNAIRV